MALELVVFDMAGTTVYDGNAVSDCLRAELSAAGLSVEPAAVKEVMGLPKPVAIRELVAQSPALRDRVAELHRGFVARMLHHYATDPTVAAMPGATAGFAALRQAGVKVALDTGFSRDIAQALIDRLGWNAAIDASVTSDEVPRGRPFADMIQHLMGRLGVASADCVAKVGDTPSDLQEGLNAGCRWVIGVTNGTHTRAELERWPHTHLVTSVADVAGLLLDLAS
jgi:phosphonatase-like hydrolase